MSSRRVRKSLQCDLMKTSPTHHRHAWINDTITQIFPLSWRSHTHSWHSVEIFSSLVLARKILTRAPKFPVLGLLRTWTEKDGDGAYQQCYVTSYFNSCTHMFLKKKMEYVSVITAWECFMTSGGKGQASYRESWPAGQRPLPTTWSLRWVEKRKKS